MTCIHMAGGIVCINPWGRLKLGNRYITVDFHEYCGPSFEWVSTGKPYDPVDENDPIWPLFEAWHDKYRAKKAKQEAKRAKDAAGRCRAQGGDTKSCHVDVGLDTPDSRPTPTPKEK